MPGSLVICRSPAALPRLRHLRLAGPVTVASDDPRVQRAAAVLPAVHAVRFIEQNDSFYAVADEVVRVVELINGWLASFAIGEDGLWPETLDWGHNVEGGLTTQRVQDALLLIRSYRELLRDSGATEIHLIAEPAAAWADLVLAAVARGANTTLVRHPVRPFARWRETGWSRLRPHAVAGYYLLNVLRLGAGRRGSNPARPATILFQLGSSLRKHVDNIAPLMLALQGRGERIAAVCWSASERYSREVAPAQLAAHGLAAIRLERWLTLADLWAGLRLGWRTRRLISRAARAPGPWQQLQHAGVPLAPLLEESLRHFLVAELPQRLRYQRALAVALAGVPPKAFKPWAGPESFEGRAAQRLWRAHPAPPLVFHYWLGAALAWPYANPGHRLDLFLAAGPHEARLARHDYALAEAQVEIVGQARYTGYAEFAANVTADKSRRTLGLPPGRRYIGFDPNCMLRGYQSAREQADMTATLLRAARREPGLVIVVKPHPSYPIAHLQPLFDEAARPNVIVLDRVTPVKDFLNAVDLIVTKYSTLILEGALMRRPAIAALFDGDERFKVYGDLPAIVHTPAELEELLVGLGAEAAFGRWQADRLAHCARRLPDFYHRADRPAAEIAAATLLRRLTSAPH